MTEEDTFRYLTRLPYFQLIEEMRDSSAMTDNDRDRWCRARGWTRQEFIKYRNEHHPEDLYGPGPCVE